MDCGDGSSNLFQPFEGRYKSRKNTLKEKRSMRNSRKRRLRKLKLKHRIKASQEKLTVFLFVKLILQKKKLKKLRAKM